jgi:putative transcriptional regulator
MKKTSRMKLKLARIEKNLTQQQLADLVDATRQTIGLIEKGDYNPTLKLCIKIAKALGHTLDPLFWEDEQNEKKTF